MNAYEIFSEYVQTIFEKMFQFYHSHRLQIKTKNFVVWLVLPKMKSNKNSPEPLSQHEIFCLAIDTSVYINKQWI